MQKNCEYAPNERIISHKINFMYDQHFQVKKEKGKNNC